MTIQPFILTDWLKPITHKSIFSFRLVLQCICLLIASYFTIATETRLISEKQKNSTSLINHSKEFHQKAIEISKCFLPSTCPLFQHMIKCYQKHFENKKKPEIKKSLPLKRIYLKRNSEKQRAFSEKANNKNINTNTNSKNTPTRKLTPNNRNMTNRIKINKIKQSVKDIPCPIISKGLTNQYNSEAVFKDCLRIQTEQRELSSESNSDTINCIL